MIFPFQILAPISNFSPYFKNNDQTNIHIFENTKVVNFKIWDKLYIKKL